MTRNRSLSAKSMLWRGKRVLAGSMAAVACVSVALAQTSFAQDVPTTPGGERFYERVTPAFKNGGIWGPTILSGSAELADLGIPPDISLTGNEFLGTSVQWSGDTGSLANETRWLMSRDPSLGWDSSRIDPDVPNVVITGRTFSIYGAAADLSFVTLISGMAIDPQDGDGNPPFAGANDVYGYAPGAASSGSGLLSCPPAPAPPCTDPAAITTPANFAIRPTSADGQVTVFETTEPMTPGASGAQIYANDGGSIRRVSEPLGTVPPGATQVGANPALVGDDTNSAGANVPGAVGGWPNAISEDGSRIFFAAPVKTADTRVYVRVGDTRTLEVSRLRGSADAPSKVKFRGASTDGNRALITTSQALLPAVGATSASSDPNTVEDVYLWTYDEVNDPANDSPDALTRLTGLPQVGGGPAADGQTGLSVVGRSDDLTRVYFTTRSTVPGDTPADGNLYVAELPQGDPQSGEIRFIATFFTGNLPSNEAGVAAFGGCLNARNVGAQSDATCAAASPSGRYLAFQSAMPLTPEDRDANGASVCEPPIVGSVPSRCRTDIFVYDAVEASLSLASGAVAPVVGNGQFDAVFDVNQRNLSVVDSGRAFFATKEPLMVDDVNTAMDVYEFHDGTLSLISKGTGALNSLFVGVSADGVNAFFLTADGLRDDEDGSSDFYNARLGDTYVSTDRDCDVPADSCQAPGRSGTPIAPVTDSPSEGNVDAGPRISLTAAVSRAARRRAARKGVLPVRVRVSAPGALKAVAKARFKARKGAALRTHVIARKARTALSPGRVVIRLNLSDAAMRRLARGRKLNVVLRVSRAGARSSVLTFGLKR